MDNTTLAQKSSIRFPWPRPPIDPPLAYDWLRENEPIHQVATVGRQGMADYTLATMSAQSRPTLG